MSDSEEDGFHMQSDDESDEYGAVAGPSKLKAKAAATSGGVGKKPKAVAGARPKATTTAPKAKKAPLKTKQNAPNDSVSDIDISDRDDHRMDVDSDVTSTVAAKKTKKTVAGQSSAAGGKENGAGKGKTASETYQMLSQLEHILLRPDSYIGSVEHLSAQMWVLNKAKKEMEFRQISYVPGFFKIFDEILVNAADNKINDPTMDTFKVTIDREANTISVYNNGKGIPIEIHSQKKIWIPEMIFGYLLTSSNYDDDQKKLTGGRNGFGAKLANIYSHEFVIETADKNTLKKYKQVFSKNMSVKSVPKITDNKKGDEWTKVTFKPDLARFGMAEIDEDTEALLMKRVYDMAGTVKDVKVFLNDERLKIKGFKQYMEMYLHASNEAKTAEAGGAAQPKVNAIYEASPDGRWEIGFALSDGQPQQVSFANAISTTKGGTHVDAVTTQLANKLMDKIKKQNKAAPVKPFQIKNHIWVFVNALVENPAFDSQTKETLTLKASAFGSKLDLTEDFIKKVSKSGIVENVLNWAKFKSDQMMKKTDGAKRSRIGGIVKLEDANNAGGRHASKCTLILTEGDSAKALAVAGLSVVGRDNYGVFPLRGKLLNVREANHDQIMKNVEIQYIKQIMGLKHNVDYQTVDQLRYGKLMIMTDQDHDGSHIKGLIINFLDHFYPSLLKIPGFLVEFITPIVKVWRGKTETSFYTMPEYEEWKASHNEGRGWESKYYKGLGTSTAVDAKKYFSDLPKHKLPFQGTQPGDRDLIDLAFNKKKADDRKEWLRQFKPGTFLDHDIDEVPIADFVNKELILFSMADNIRSIPSMADGLKPGQRKVMFGCFKRNLTKEIKVAQLAGYVSEKTAYHHGEASLTMTIVGLAQNFVGNNNINLLEPNGQFGTRTAGGKDAASARYIFTNVPRMTRVLFHPHDEPILNHQIEDDMGIEPEYYLPVIPLVLVNGADGIGTGWSTSIPNYNPIDIVDNLRRKMADEPVERMTPWYRDYKGSIERIAEDKYKCAGIVTKLDATTIEITELPIKRWTQDYKEMLEEWVTGTEIATIKDYKEYHTVTTVHFVITMSEAEVRKAEAEGLEKYFRLTSTISTGNMVCFDLHGKIRKYTSAEEIMDDFYPKRLEYYSLRKQHLADELTRQYERLNNQARFVQMIIKKELTVSNKKKADLEGELRKLNFRGFAKVKKAQLSGESEPTLEEEDEGQAGEYDYLLGMAIWSLTKEKVEKLLNERDAKQSELDVLLKLKPTDIWNKDLDDFLVEWQRALDGDILASKRVRPKAGRTTTTGAAKKAAVAKARKAAGMSSGDEDDESDRKDFGYKPAKKAASKKISPKKAIVPAKRLSDEMDASSEEDYAIPAKKPAPVTKTVAMPSIAGAGITKTKPKPIGIGKEVIKTRMDLDDSDDDDYSKIASAPKPVQAKAGPSTIASKQAKTASSTPKQKAKPKGAKSISSDIMDVDESSEGSDSASEPEPDLELDDEDEDEEVFEAKRKAGRGKKPSAGPSISSSAASVTKAKPAPNRAVEKVKSKPTAVPAKPKKKVVRDEDESDGSEFGAGRGAGDDSIMSDYAPPPPKTNARPGRVAAEVKKKYVDILGSDDE